MNKKFIEHLAIGAGKIQAKWFGKVGVKYTKADNLDYVTKVDLLSNKYLVGEIKKKFPTHGIISEETGKYNESAEYVWIIDPLDGTSNFAHSIAQFCVLICLVKKGVPQMAVVYDPIHKEMFFAERNKGAFLNGKKIHCASKKTIPDTFGGLTHTFTAKKMRFISEMSDYVKGQKFRISMLSSIGIMVVYVAAGRRDWFVSMTGGVWDLAAPAFICQEAGCKVSNLKGNTWSIEDNHLIIANKYLYPQLLKIAQVLKD